MEEPRRNLFLLHQRICAYGSRSRKRDDRTGNERKKFPLPCGKEVCKNIYKIILRGFRDPDMIYDTDRMDSYGKYCRNSG